MHTLGGELEEKELFEEGVKLMRWFAKPFSTIGFTRAGVVDGEIAQKAGKQGKGMPQCKAVAALQKKDDDEDDQEARGGASKRQKTVQETGQFTAAVNRRKRAPGGRNDTSSGDKAKKKASSGHNHTE